jgi:hypothetical protein
MDFVLKKREFVQKSRFFYKITLKNLQGKKIRRYFAT